MLNDVWQFLFDAGMKPRGAILPPQIVWKQMDEVLVIS